MFTLMNEGFQRCDPAPASAQAKAFLVITAEHISDGAFTTQIVGLSLNGLKDMEKDGIPHVAEPTEKQRAIVKWLPGEFIGGNCEPDGREVHAVYGSERADSISQCKRTSAG
jgi:hypothetical protein